MSIIRDKIENTRKAETDIVATETDVNTKLDITDKRVCTAWVVFDGSNGTIRDSYNISSVVRNGRGDYTINFLNAMATINYTASYEYQFTTDGSNWEFNIPSTILRTANSLHFITAYWNANSAADGATYDFPIVSVLIFGGK